MYVRICTFFGIHDAKVIGRVIYRCILDLRIPMRQFSAGKDVQLGVVAREKLLAGVERLADAVRD